MKQSKFIFTAVLAAHAVILMPLMKATTVEVLGAGSSAIWQTAAIGAWTQLAGTGALHYTVGGTCTSGNCSQIHDSRSTSILNEGGNIWIVWSADMTKVWAYISVDSVVGNRSFFAVPRAQIQLDAQTLTLAGQDLISSTLWGNDASALPSTIYNAVNNATLTTAFTDIRPEDAKMAQCRVASALGAALPSGYYGAAGLGYSTSCTALLPTPIYSAFSSAQANPVAFNLSGTDPFTSEATKAYTTVSIGASPIVFIINRTDAAGLGAPGLYTTINQTQVQSLFDGSTCDSNAFGVTGPSNVPVTVVLREPLSGTMNTTEYTTFYTKISKTTSQETGVNPSLVNNNPLNLPCTAGGGKRMRAIGTSQVVKSGVLPNADSIGYVFFSYGNVSPIAGTASYGYLKLSGVDPIQASYTNGELPVCTSPCPAAPGTSFPNLRNGTYSAWSVLRAVTDASGVNLTNTKSLVLAIQDNINSTVPDFVPFSAVGGDPGLKYYRSHFAQASVAPHNGLSGQKETGGDVGGCIEPIGAAPGVLNCHAQ